MQSQIEHIKKYQALYLEEYKKEISEEKAREELTALLVLLNAVHKHRNKSLQNEYDSES